MTLPLLLYPFMVLLLVVWLPGRTVKAAQLNYDPPLPSSDFGTPEATAKLASQGDFSVSSASTLACRSKPRWRR